MLVSLTRAIFKYLRLQNMLTRLGIAAGFHPRSEACERICEAALRKYGSALWKINKEGKPSEAGWKAWLVRLCAGSKEDCEKEAKPLFVSDGEY